jgi:peptidyl-prolyl cis-trans isomerase SurA
VYFRGLSGTALKKDTFYVIRFSTFRLLLSAAWLCLSVTAIFAFSPAEAQSLRIAAIVNDSVISVYDVNERMHLIMFSANIPDTPEARQQLGPQVLRTLIDEQLQLQEAKRLNVTPDQNEYQETITRLETQNHIPSGQLSDYLSSHGIDPSTLQNQIRATLSWAQVVRRRAATYANVTPEEVTEALDRIKLNMTKPSHLVAEIFLAVDAPEDEPTVRANIQRISDQLRGGAAFLPLARQFSQSASAQQGGDLGWVPEGQLDPELDQALEHMAIGQISDPIRTTGGYYILLLRDRRAAPVAGETEASVSRLLLPTAGGMEDRAAVEAARRIQQSANGCPNFLDVSKTISPTSVMSAVSAKLSDMAPEFRNLVNSLTVGHTSDPLPAPGGVQIIMVCEKKESEGAKPPSPDEVERSLRGDKLEQFSRRLLRDLRQTAFIDLRV